MAIIDEVFAAALVQHQLGHLAEAERLGRSIIGDQANHADAWHLLGVIGLQTRRYEMAIDCIRRTLALNPHDASAHNNLGNVLKEQGMLEEATASYRRALEEEPSLVEAHSNLGTALHGLGRHEEAILSFRQAIEVKPSFAEAVFGLGVASRALERLDEAVLWYRRAIELKPDHVGAYTNLGNALRERGELDEAIACYERALAISPNHAETLSNLGNTLKDIGRLDEAVTCQRRAIELGPGLAEAHYNLGTTLNVIGNLDEAVVCFRRALEIRPGFAGAYRNLGVTLKNRGELAEAISHHREALKLEPQSAVTHGSLLYLLPFCPNSDAAEIYEESQRYNRQHARHLTDRLARHSTNSAPERRLRVGYVSPDFCNHCQSFFTVPLLSAHDREQVEIFCYADVLRPDGITKRLSTLANVWRDILGLTDEQVAELIREDQIDVLVDLTMHMARGRPLVFARKPAPVQVTWLAYPGTTGLTAIDYRLTDPYLDPPGVFDRYYAEQSIRLPETFWCYDPLTNEPSVSTLPAHRNGYITFGCLNNFAKVNETVLQLWAGVLHVVKRSRLLLLAPHGSARQRTLETLEREGIDPDRILFVDFQPRRYYLQQYQLIDIGLDTLPYNGHTTSLDSYWMGVPVVSLVGNTPVGRAGLSQLTNLRLTELIANTPEEYVSIAARLANDIERLSQLRQSLRDRLRASPLMDADRFARSVEQAYRTSWQRWCKANA